MISQNRESGIQPGAGNDWFARFAATASAWLAPDGHSREPSPSYLVDFFDFERTFSPIAGILPGDPSSATSEEQTRWP